jgi:hypothetical protein
MQTFLPDSNFKTSAKVLDKKRCWKQVVETKQLLCNLHAENLPEDWKLSKDYVFRKRLNHPITQMWKGYEELLKHYYNIFLFHCKYEHNIKTKLLYLNCIWTRTVGCDSNPIYVEDNTFLSIIMNKKFFYKINSEHLPKWLGDKKFHASHRSNLLRKNIEFYSKYNWKENPNNPYIWMNNDGKFYTKINN